MSRTERQKEKIETRRLARKLWIKHHGPISQDEFGLPFEIHHTDGNPFNNVIENLVCLSVHEHYEIHFWQNDWAACGLILGKLQASPQDIKEMCRLAGEMRSGANHQNYDPSIHRLRNCQTGEILEANRYELRELIGACARDIDRLLRRVRKTTRGWEIDDGSPHRPPTPPKPSKAKVIRPSLPIRRWRHRTTDVVIEASRRELAKTYELDVRKLSRVERGKEGSHRGWEIDTGRAYLPPNDPTVHCWRNTVTGEIVEASRKQMAVRYDLRLNHLLCVVKGERKSHRDWVLVRE